MKAIRLTFEHNDSCVIPITDNFEALTNVENIDPRAEDLDAEENPDLAAEVLAKHYKEVKLAFGAHNTPDIEIIDVKEDLGEILQCAEFDDLWFYSETGYPSYPLYDRPEDETPEYVDFCSRFAYECYRGRIYSKDFSYFDCFVCHREICEQKPSNGWHVQYRLLGDCEMICTSCYEEDLMENGVDLDTLLEERNLPGSFFDKRQLEEAGFSLLQGLEHKLVGHGYSGYVDPERIFEDLEARREELEGKKVIINYESLAIGGMGGYVSVWAK